jgi:osmotically-inducible protein OsmY
MQTEKSVSYWRKALLCAGVLVLVFGFTPVWSKTPAAQKKAPTGAAKAKTAKEPAKMTQKAKAVKAPVQGSNLTGTGAIAEKVVAELKGNPKLASGVRVHISSKGGSILLKGTTSTLMQRQIIAETLEGIAGVRHIESTVGITPRRMSDAQWKEEIRNALASVPSYADPKKVQIHMKGGDVTLQGEAGDVDEIWNATSTLMNVPGIQHIYNEVEVAKASPEYSDAQLQDKVVSEIRKIKGVDTASLNIQVKGGKAFISGELPSLDLLARVKEAAKTVTSVDPDTKGLVVRATADYFKPSETISSAEITKNVYAALKKIPDLDPGRISVYVQDGTVGLTGTVGSLEMESRILEAVSGVDGVDVIGDNLTVVTKKQK